MLPPLNSNNEAGITQILCACGTGPIEMKTLVCCRRCYDRRHHSLRFFSGMREHVLERDRFRCRACGQQRRLLVHHPDLHNEPKLLVTLCSRCHVRIHRSLGVRCWLSGLLLKLWRELHQHEPVQLPLRLGPWQKGDVRSVGSNRRGAQRSRFSPKRRRARSTRGKKDSCCSGA